MNLQKTFYLMCCLTITCILSQNSSYEYNVTFQMSEDQYNSLVALVDAPEFTLDGNSYLGNVVALYDGDSTKKVIKVCDQFYRFDFRLDGIDTPEVSSGVVRDFGKEVRDILRSMILNKIVRVSAGQGDKYGRILSTVYGWTTRGVININQYEVEHALAKAYDGGTKDQFQQEDYDYFIENYRNTKWPVFMNYPFDAIFVQETTANSSVCSFPCQVCSINGSLCQYCAEDYFLFPSTLECIYIPQDVSGIVYYEDKIYECIAGCQACSSIHTCQSCSIGFTLNQVDKNCIPCKPPCKSCQADTASICITCYSGFFFSVDTCLPCSGQKCLKCSSDIQCDECIDGFYPNDDDICVQCQNGCKQCDSGTGLCSQCEEGYAMVTVISGQQQCVACLVGCNNCDGSNIVNCFGCVTGYYNDNEDLCKICPLQCAKCSSESSCEQCSDGYVLADDKCVKQCKFPCQHCKKGTIQCKRCYGGYNLVGNQCQADHSCNQTFNCRYCPMKYGIIPVDPIEVTIGTCESCSISNCSRCMYNHGDSVFECRKCILGFGLISDGSCQICPDSCSSCNSPNYCLRCKPGFFMKKQQNIPTGKCLPCSSFLHCETCYESANICKTCQIDYQLVGSNCVSYSNIKIDVQLDVNPTNFYTFINQFKAAVIALLGYTDTMYIRDIIIISIIEGSTNVGFYVVLRDQSSTSAESSYQMLGSGLSTGVTVAGMSVLTSALQRRNFPQKIYDQNKEKNSENMNKGLIIGITVGVTFGVVILTIIGAYLYKRKSFVQVGDFQNSDDSKIYPPKTFIKTEEISPEKN